jgi:hypothetical protein
VKLVVAGYRDLLPEFKGLLDASADLTGRLDSHMLSIAGGGDGLHLNQSLADGVRTEMEAAMRNQVIEYREFACRCRTHVGVLDGMIDELRPSLEAMTTRYYPDHNDVPQPHRVPCTKTRTAASAEIGRLRDEEIPKYNGGATDAEGVASDLEYDIGLARGKFEDDNRDIRDCDDYFHGEFDKLAGDMGGS